MNLSDPVQRNRLFRAIEHHNGIVEPIRKVRRRAIEQMAGDLYPGSKVRKVIAGLLRQAHDTHVLSLAPRCPRAALTARKPELSAFAKVYAGALNQHTAEIRLHQTLAQVASDSFFGSAFVKVYLAESLMEIEEDYDVWVDPGKGFAERKSIDDMVWDCSVTDLRKCAFICDRYQVPLEALLDNKSRYTKSAREAIYATTRNEDNSSRFVSGTTDDAAGRTRDMIELVDVLCPDMNIYTFASHGDFKCRDTKPLQTIDWTGDDDGPYKHLNLGAVPDNITSSSPSNYLYHLDVAINQSWRKLLNQMQRHKVIAVAEMPNDGDVSKYQDANDGDVVQGDPKEIGEVRFGGPDNQMTGMVAVLAQLFDRIGGNLSMRAGLGATSGTVGQDAQLGQQLTRVEAAMQIAFKDFTVPIMRELGRMLWDDPVSEYTVEIRVPGSSLSAPAVWSRRGDERQGTWSDYDFDIDPGSYRYRDPGQRAMELAQIIPQMIQEVTALMQVGGNVAEYVEMKAELHDEPRLLQIFANLIKPPDQQQMGSGPQMQMPGQKPNGNYTRTNVSGGDPNGSMIQQLLSSGSEAA